MALEPPPGPLSPAASLPERFGNIVLLHTHLQFFLSTVQRRNSSRLTVFKPWRIFQQHCCWSPPGRRQGEDPQGERTHQARERGCVLLFLFNRPALKSAVFGVETELGTTPTALALAWVAKNPNTSTVILGASKPEQVLENLKALEVLPKLTPEIMEKIEKILDNKPVPTVCFSSWRLIGF